MTVAETLTPALSRMREREIARGLRQRMTDAERAVWFAVRDRRLVGAKFKRQVPIGRFVVDFCCLEARLVVEIDGGQHGGALDAERDVWLQTQGYRVLRVPNNDVLSNLPGVLITVAAALRRGEGGVG